MMKMHAKKPNNIIKYQDDSPDNQYLFEIALQMKKASLPDLFIADSIKAALEFEGVADLMKLWRDEEDSKERNEIIADIQDLLDVCLQKEKNEFYINFNDLDKIANNIRAFKDALLLIVIEKGGISYLSSVTGIPQPSLSRFFNSYSMPQRSTLIKIAKALNLNKIKIEMFQIQKQKKE